jgi:hypothetical protein
VELRVREHRAMVVSLLIACGLAAPCALAQSAPPTTPEPQIVAEDLSGRDFGGLRLNIASQNGPLVLRAQRGTSWTQEPAAIDAQGNTVGGTVSRLLLQGDVRISVGNYKLASARAVLWIERLEPSPTKPGQFINQVAIYFDRVGDPTSEAGAIPSGDRLLMTAVIDGEPNLSVDSLRAGRPNDALVIEGERRLARFLGELLGINDNNAPAEPALTGGVSGPAGAPIVPGMSQPFEPNSPLGRSAAFSAGVTPPPQLGPADRSTPIFRKRGVVTISAGEPTLITSPDENILVITGGAVVQYSDVAAGRSLQLTAQRAVIFLQGGELRELLRQSPEKVRGIYLEGDVVATDGQYTLRGPYVYYDIQKNDALMLDAVFWTYDQRRGLPLYVRAKALRQTQLNQVSGKDVRISTSSFFTPQLSVGAQTVTITRETRPSEPTRTKIEATGLTGRVNDRPLAYFPSFTGDLDRYPLQEVSVENSSATGAGVKTKWDAFGLFGIDPPPGWNADLLLDGWIRRGFGIGTNLTWNTREVSGSVQGYIVPSDGGQDILSSGVKRDAGNNTRGMFLAEHRWTIDDRWTAFTQLSYISDERFLQTYNEAGAQSRREYENSLQLRRLDENSWFNVYVKGAINDFTPNHYLLQSQGYTVNKLPEITYTRLNDDLLTWIAPGLLTWNSSYQFTRMGLDFTKPNANEFGFNTPALALDGFREAYVNRLDTRHELSSTFDLGPVRVTPFATGRVTYWDDSFSSSSPTETDHLRFWYSGGVRAGTTLTRVYDNADSSLLDIHRLRHIIEPSVTLWSAGTTRHSGTRPVYDDSVEAINAGSAVRAGVTQTLQTQRGGPGRWRSVDVLKLSTDLVWSTDDTDARSPIGRFFEDRPEDSALGRFFDTKATWQATDALAVTASNIFDLENHQSQRTTAGLLLDHTRDFKSFVELRYLNPRSVTYVDGGIEARLTSLYTVSAVATYDTNKGEIQTISARVNREFPDFILGMKIGYSNITSEVSLGAVITPLGRDPRREQLRRLGREQADAQFYEPTKPNDLVPGP